MKKIAIISLIITAIAGIIIPLVIHFSNKPPPIHIEQTIIGGSSNISKTIRIER